MPATALQCPMCHTSLDAGSVAAACAACPLYHVTSGCRVDLVACPQCGYHSLPGEHVAPHTEAGSPLSDAPHADAVRALPGAAAPERAPEVPPAALCAGAQRLHEVRSGTRARLLGFEGIDDGHLGRLAAYGLLPGVSIEVLQRFPAVILGVYQAELALETELAAGVWVLPESG